MKLMDLCSETLPGGLDLSEEILIGAKLCGEIPRVAAEHVGRRPLWLADPRTWDALGRADTLRVSGRPENGPGLHLLPDEPHANTEQIGLTCAAVEAGGFSGIIAVGAGTVNDIAKMAATLSGVPYMAFGTAASMNGYASGIAAILVDGLKTTIAARPPRAIILDSEILCQAPPALAAAGLGDLLSKPVSTADWWLGNRLEGSGFEALPGRIVDEAVAHATEHAAGLPAGDRDAHEALARALVLSGVSMVVAGSSSPASGGEHLLSHLWDMEALVCGRELRLHGAQVGVATCLCAALYQLLVELENPEFPKTPNWPRTSERIRIAHGELAEAILPQAEKKFSGFAARSALLRAEWPQMRAELAGLALPSAAEVRTVLQAAGAPASLDALGIESDEAFDALARARDIRDRYTVLDLAFELGFFPGGIRQVILTAGV